ncbi:Protein-glutamine gamma-glutamyltransferase [Burkholderiales bacterium]|nr:Protein-glutamine gamma-glutamyltransferase [Burkholderiales bacterium]
MRPAARRGRRRARTSSPPLSATQIRWLGALLVCAQLPQAPHLPLWVAAFGLLLVGLRLALLRRDRARPDAPPARIPSWTLVLFAIAAALAVRASYGYLLGRDPSVAFLYILVGIKFLETRTVRDGSLLVALASFLLVTPFFTSQSPLSALAVLPALLVLGATLDVLARPPGHASERRPPQALARAGALVLQGIPIAALLFVLFPRIGAPLWGVPGETGAQTGLSDTMAPGTISELSLSDAVAFRVDFDAPPPPPVQRYWRGPVLSRFDGQAWSLMPRPGTGNLTPWSAGGVSYEVTLEPHGKPWLFALDLPASLPRPAGDDAPASADAGFAFLARDQQLIARTPVTQVIRYAQRSMLRDAYPQADAEEAREYLRLPLRGNPRTTEFARELRARHAGDRELVGAILAWFRAEAFVYTLTPPLLDRDPVDAFLFDTRRGFCEHYASAFVVMMRAAGIPARVVTGYQGGEVNPRGGYLIVRQSDAHAWAEVIVDGAWQRVDPTGAVAPSRIEIGLSQAVAAGEPVPLFARLDAGWIKNVQLAFDALNHEWRRNVVGFNRDRQRELWRDLSIDRYAGWQIAALAGALALAWAGVTLALAGFAQARRERAQALWGEACLRLERAGLPRMPHEGPIAYAARASRRWPQFAIAFSAIAESYAALHYGPPPARPGEHEALVATLARAVDVLPGAAQLRATAA